MRITKLELENFKRFTKLTVDMTQLSTPPKLVLLIGANGSGKSSVFDAFAASDTMIKMRNEKSSKFENINYYKKDKRKKFQVINHFDKYGQLVCTDEQLMATALFNESEIKLAKFRNEALQVFYGRTSLRQVPRLTRLSFKNGFNVEEDSDRPLAWIDQDERFENDLEQTYRDLLNLLFDQTRERTNREIVEKFIAPISNALAKIFGDSKNTSIGFTSIVPPGDGQYAEVLFSKGNSVIHYNLLSSGEKEVFNILLNLSVRSKYYQDTIYFIDEMDLHLEYNTQIRLLKEITEHWIPESCQLWTASHSLGFIKYANESGDAAIIDFDELDFDFEQTLYPTLKNSADVYEIAVSKEFLGSVFSGKNLVFSEGKDDDLYNSLGIPDVLFATEKNAKNNKESVFVKSQNLNYYGVLDRDFLNDNDLIWLKKKYPKLIFLKYYSIENYLYHPDNLQEYFDGVNKPFNKREYLKHLLAEKADLLDDMILKGIASIRSSYQFLFRQDENKDQLKLFVGSETGAGPILEMLKSDDFETFYKVFPAKDYGRNILERKNLKSFDLVKTKWIKNNLSSFIEQSIKDSKNSGR